MSKHRGAGVKPWGYAAPGWTNYGAYWGGGQVNWDYALGVQLPPVFRVCATCVTTPSGYTEQVSVWNVDANEGWGTGQEPVGSSTCKVRLSLYDDRGELIMHGEWIDLVAS